MKTTINKFFTISLMAGLVIFVGCSDDDDGIPIIEVPVEVASKEYTLGSVSNPDISGTAEFKIFSNDSTVIELDLDNTPGGAMHPAHIHFDTAAEGGDIALTLATVDGDTGESSTHVTELNDGTPISYEELLTYDGYINVHLSVDEISTLVAQGDIGQNELTDESISYSLSRNEALPLGGEATFTKRVNGEALAVLQVDGTPEDGMHPAHIHVNTAAEGGAILYTFNMVNGATGISKSNVAMLDDETPFVYDDVLEVDGYINVHLSMEELGVIVAQGDIGQNDFTGESKAYALNEVGASGVSGDLSFLERNNGEALAVISLENTIADTEHPAHIHLNSISETGAIAFTFTPIDGNNGLSYTNVATLDNETAFVYEDVLTFDGYVNVHLDMDNLPTILANANIGSNE